MPELFIDIRALGVPELEKAFGKLDRTMQRKVYRQAARAAMRPVHQAAKARAPVLTGATRAKVKLRAGRRSRQRISMIVRSGTRAEMGIPPTKSAYYPAIQEYGSRARNIPARPWLRPAIDSNRSRVRTMLQNELRTRTNRAVIESRSRARVR